MLRVQEIKFCKVNIKQRWAPSEFKSWCKYKKGSQFQIGKDLNIFKNLLDPNMHTVLIRVYLNFIVKQILMCKFDPSTVLLLL